MAARAARRTSWRSDGARARRSSQSRELRARESWAPSIRRNGATGGLQPALRSCSESGRWRISSSCYFAARGEGEWTGESREFQRGATLECAALERRLPSVYAPVEGWIQRSWKQSGFPQREPSE